MRGLLGRSQTLLPQRQYVQRGIQVSVDLQLTARTLEYPIGETHPLVGSQSMPTTTTRLTGVGGVYSNILSSGPFCLHRQQLPKSPPRRVRDGLSQTVIVHHPVDFQILYRYQPEAVHYPARMLVREVAPAPACSLMYTRHHLAPFGSLGRALLLPGELTARLSQRLFFRMEEARVVNLITRGESGERLQSNVYPYLLTRHWQRGRLPLTGEGSVPLTRVTPTYAYRLGSAFEGAVKHYLHRPNFGEVERIAYQISPVAILGIADRIVSTVATKSGIARLVTITMTRFHPTKEGLKSQFYPLGDVLQHLTMHAFEGRACLLEERNTSLSLVPPGITAFLLMSVFAVSKGVVVQPTAFLKHFAQSGRLGFGRSYSVQEGLSHLSIIAQMGYS
jgi:hypothetical protein